MGWFPPTVCFVPKILIGFHFSPLTRTDGPSMTSTPSTVAVGASNEAGLESSANGGASVGVGHQAEPSINGSGIRSELVWVNFYFVSLDFFVLFLSLPFCFV